METKVTLFELLVSCGGLVAGIISAWIHMKITVAALKTEICYIKKEVESEKAENKENYNILTIKIDKLIEAINSLKVEISKK